MDTATKVLEVFLANPKENISGQYISEQIGVSRNAVWKGIEQLRKSGYLIEGVTNKGYVITTFPTKADKHYLQAQLSPFWKDILVVEATDSTNQQLKALADKGQPQGTLFMGREQTRGKGRLGRQWSSNEGGLWLSILLRPKLPMEDLSLLTLTMAAIVRESIQLSFGIDTEIKWPNDILCQGKKVAGILTEVKGDMDGVHYVVVGLGVNCNNNIEPELTHKAISLQELTNKEINLNSFMLTLTQTFEAHYVDFLRGDNAKILHINRRHSYIIGKEITISTVKGNEMGKVIDISGDGSLVIQQGFTLKKVVSGDVSLSETYSNTCKD